MSVEEKKEKKDRKSRHDDNPLRKALLPNHMAKSSLIKLLAEATHKSRVSLGKKGTVHKESRTNLSLGWKERAFQASADRIDRERRD